MTFTILRQQHLDLIEKSRTCKQIEEGVGITIRGTLAYSFLLML